MHMQEMSYYFCKQTLSPQINIYSNEYVAYLDGSQTHTPNLHNLNGQAIQEIEKGRDGACALQEGFGQ